MAKIFRIHKGSINTLSNWDYSQKIGTTAIASILDPVGATDKKEITSIPSPFARMDLVKQAFKIVANSQLDGNTIYHKLVSDTLDVGQIFFNIEKYRDIIEILVWNKNLSLNELRNSIDEEHKRLGNTYKTYLEQDGDEYNFNQMDCIYLLNYIDSSAPKTMNIIGATSPATIFFTSANDLSYVGNKIIFGDDKPFDGDYKPLYKRNFDYIKYWWSLKCSRPDFPKLFPEVDLYLDKSFQQFTNEQKEQLRCEINAENNYYNNQYEEIPVSSTVQQYVMVLDQKLRRKPDVTNISSGFEMRISDDRKKSMNKVPLALPISKYSEPTYYVQSNWNMDTKVPYIDLRPIGERTLPGDGATYPYVTIGDFLEDTILRIPHKFNKKSFFNGNDDNPDAPDSYLLPLKKTYFDYFDVEDLEKTISGKKIIEICRLSGKSVKVILRIPIKDNKYVQYERIYYNDSNADALMNKGGVIDKELTLGLYPNLKYFGSVKPYYRVALLDEDSVDGSTNEYHLSFYDENNESIDNCESIYRNRTINGTRNSTYEIDFATFVINDNFKYMTIEHEFVDIHGVIIPRFIANNGGNKFRFAIDFGTTNTHIEYSINGGESKAFCINENDMQFHKLHLFSANLIEPHKTFDSNFMPEFIGADYLYNYPMRTVLSESNNTIWRKPVFSMANVNIPFTYEKKGQPMYNRISTNLKWTINIEDKQRTCKYIECLLTMLRNKVLLNNGDLSQTEIVWFYPASMTQNRFNRFKMEWEKQFEELFGAPSNNLVAISESIAPYYYHKTKSGATSSVSIDIGGGTTDVLVVEKGISKLLTSFRFAGNAIFGDGYSFDSDSNGFINQYKDLIINIIDENNLNVLKSSFDSISETKISSDIIAFFFSLASNKDIEKANIDIDFGKMLADDQKGKYAIILFYVAIIFHVANLMKSKELEMPRYITFSGNGSKILNILTTDDEVLSNFTKIIFEEVYNKTYSIDGLDIIRTKNSKEATCKGGILLNPFHSQNYNEIKEIKSILLGVDETSIVPENMTYDNLSDVILDKVVLFVNKYIDFTFNLNKKFSFYDNFDADRGIMDKVKGYCKKDIKSYLENGISLKKTEIQNEGADNKIEESLFFYPIVGIINAVVRNIYK